MLKKFLKNSLYSIVNYFLLVILNLLVRKTLILSLSIEYVGYEALFTDVFALLHVADLGLDSIITFNLYDRLSKNKSEIIDVMAVAKKMYTIIAFVMLALGTGYVFFIPIIISGEEKVFLIIFVYMIQVLNLFFSYLTGYKRLLFVADQKEYICLKWESFVMLCVQISRIAILLFFQNYFFYVTLCLVQTLWQNIGINIRCNREYNIDLRKKTVSMKKINIGLKNMGSFLAHKISIAVYNATDNIIITSIMGLSQAGLYSNYYMVTKCLNIFANRMMKPMQPSIGNFLYSGENDEKKYLLLKRLNRISFYLASFISNSMIQLTTPFIIVWLGKEYVQKERLVLLMAINFFIGINQDFVYYVRNSYGQYHIDQKYMICSAISNLSISILLGKHFGLEGIVVGTIIGHIFIWYGRAKFVFTEVFKNSMKAYWFEQKINFLIYFGQLMIIHIISANIENSIQGIIYKEILVIVICILTIICRDKNNLKAMYQYICRKG